MRLLAAARKLGLGSAAELLRHVRVNVAGVRKTFAKFKHAKKKIIKIIKKLLSVPMKLSFTVPFIPNFSVNF